MMADEEIQAGRAKKKKSSSSRGNGEQNSFGDLSKARFVVVHHEGVAIRLVEPYFHDFETTFKERWKGKTLLEVYETEFKVTTTSPSAPDASGSYFEKAIRAGFIRVNREKCLPDRLIRQGDRVSRLSHRHEPPVVYRHASELVVHDDGDLIVVNKPASVPIHPSGSYRFNSLLYLLAIERPELGELYTIHRLDRLTSGLVILARNSQGALTVSNAIQGRLGFRAQKTYIARVTGRFPMQEDELRGKKGVISSHDSTGDSRWVNVSFPINVIDPKKGVHVCDEVNGKESLSRFFYLSYDSISNTSLVKCEPVTGRTHQLRLHLQLLGFPITNDPNYGPLEPASKRVRTQEANVSGSALDEDEDDVREETGVCNEEFGRLCDEAFATARNERQETEFGRDDMDESISRAIKDLCHGCSHLLHPMRHREIWLHACRFRVHDEKQNSPVLDYRVPLPHWIEPFSFAESTIWND